MEARGTAAELAAAGTAEAIAKAIGRMNECKTLRRF